ncbi:MAG: hypothetical protein K2P92_06575 [Bdellovibrionaceae bacterium]|nr:hypothetical protein [Pseudobdellovibrionaceae bacterium]
MKTHLPQNKKTKLMPELKELENLIGEFIQYWGFKKIHGRIWAHLYTSSEPLDSQTLIDRLKVSKGLISLAMRDLIEYDVIQPDSTGKHGVTFYRANPDLMYVITNVLRKREAVMISAVSSCVERLTSKNQKELAQSQINPTNLENIKEMTASAQGLLGLFIMQASQQTQNANINIFSELKFESAQ